MTRAKPISAIRNLGPASAASFARAGIHTAESLIAMGADAAYSKLLQIGQKPHFIGYYALVLGLQGRPWTDCTPDEKRALRVRFDALKSRHHDKGRSQLEAALDDIGVRNPAR